MVNIGSRPLPHFQTCRDYIESQGIEAVYLLLLGDINQVNSLMSLAGGHNIPIRQLSRLAVLIWNTVTAFHTIPEDLPSILVFAVLERFKATGDSLGDVVFFYSNLLKISPSLEVFTRKLNYLKQVGYAFDRPVDRTIFLMGNHPELIALHTLWESHQVSTEEVNKVERVLAAMIKFMRSEEGVSDSFIIDNFFREYHSLRVIPLDLLAEAYFVILKCSPRSWLKKILSSNSPEGLNLAIKLLGFIPRPFFSADGQEYTTTAINDLAFNSATGQLHSSINAFVEV